MSAERESEIAVGAQASHQIRLDRAGKGGTEQRVDAGGILGTFGANLGAHLANLRL